MFRVNIDKHDRSQSFDEETGRKEDPPPDYSEHDWLRSLDRIMHIPIPLFYNVICILFIVLAIMVIMLVI